MCISVRDRVCESVLLAFVFKDMAVCRRQICWPLDHHHGQECCMKISHENHHVIFQLGECHTGKRALASLVMIPYKWSTGRSQSWRSSTIQTSSNWSKSSTSKRPITCIWVSKGTWQRSNDLNLFQLIMVPTDIIVHLSNWHCYFVQVTFFAVFIDIKISNWRLVNHASSSSNEEGLAELRSRQWAK